MSAIKFRPSLSATQITHIVNTLETAPDSAVNRECIKLLKTFKLKADHGIVSPSHVASGRPSLTDSLGFTEQDESIESLLTIYNTNKSILTESQLTKVNLHRYTNDLMTTEEEQEYESR